jgi:hypothetical protein
MRQLLLILALLQGTAFLAQRSPFNQREIATPDASSYRIVFTGHLHGSSSDKSGFPAGTVLANIDRLNELDAQLVLSTGDLFMDAQADHERYRHALFNRLEAPLFNAPGNHDHGAYYTRQFGPTYQSFPLGGDQVVLLDTEVDNGSLGGAQLDLLRALLLDPAPRRIFIVSHRPVWAEGDDRYGPLFEGNTRSLLGTNYAAEVQPLLEQLSARSSVYWVSGSMAGNARSSIFFQPHSPNITFIQSAIRNELRDAVLIAEVDGSSIRWSALSLTGAPVLSPEQYDADWWWSKRAVKEPFNWRLLPYLVLTTVGQATFWWGVLAGALLLMLLRWLVRRLP